MKLKNENGLPLITILMATYNGESYIQAQIESIQNQTYSNWELIISDDHSKDNTVAVIDNLMQSDHRISLHTHEQNRGSVLNFSFLLSLAADKPLVMLADQDDYWLNNKIEATFDAMTFFATPENSALPLLVYTDLEYADAKLLPLHKTIHFDIPKQNIFESFLLQNYIYGCTMMLNNALIQLCQNIPPSFENHDHWIALTAACFGKIYHLKKPTLLYRQHGSNISGSHNDNSFNKRLQRNIVNYKKQQQNAKQKIIQASLFQQRFYQVLSAERNQLLNRLATLYEKNKLLLVYTFMKHKIYRQGFFQTMLYYMYFL